MKNRKQKIGSLCLAAALSVAASVACVGCDKTSKTDFRNAPDYSQSGAEYLTWAFYSLSKNKYTIDGKPTVLEGGERMPTKEEMLTYKEAGFNTVFLNWMFQYDSRTQQFENSDMKTLMDMAYELGLKCIVSEAMTYGLSNTKTSLIVGEGANGTTTFASQEAMNSYFAEKLSDIVAHPAFYGFTLIDEPHYTLFDAIGEVYRAIKSVAPDAFVNMNLLPMQDSGSIVSYYCEGASASNYVQSYKKYIELFYEKVKPERIQYDDYPLFIDANGNTSIRTWHLYNAQIVADFCKEKGIEFHKVFQTCAYDTRLPVCRKPDATDMYWQMNIGMAMGIQGYTYWSYYPILNTAGEYYDETATFVKYDGSKNPTYYTMQQLHSEMQTTASALANFDYEGMTYYVKTPIPGDKAFLAGVKQNDLTYVEQVSLSEEGIVLCSEFTDDDVYGYYLVNATDPTKKVEETVSVSFKGFDCIQIYYNGTVKNEKMEKGTSTFTLAPGEGVFVIPFNS